MELTVSCRCGRTLQVEAAQAGSQLGCLCGNAVTVPRLSELRVRSGLAPIPLAADSRAAPEEGVKSNNPFQSPASSPARTARPRGKTLYDFLSIGGRARRWQFWCVTILSNIASVIVGSVGVGGRVPRSILLILWLAILWFTFAVIARRLHDRNKSAAWLLTFLLLFVFGSWFSQASVVFGQFVALGLMLAGLWLLVELGFLPGTIGENDYGPDPVRRLDD